LLGYLGLLLLGEFTLFLLLDGELLPL
jgi:hypothetical protein